MLINWATISFSRRTPPYVPCNVIAQIPFFIIQYLQT